MAEFYEQLSELRQGLRSYVTPMTGAKIRPKQRQAPCQLLHLHNYA